MEKGDKVMIYDDPITEQHQEGLATLVTLINSEHCHELERWEVCFDDEPERVFERNIKKR